MSTTNSKSLILVGGTGGLGTEIAKGLVTAEGFDQKVALVQASAAEEKVVHLEKMGWTIRKVDFEDEDKITSWGKGGSFSSKWSGVDVREPLHTLIVIL
jgi:uncharacterized protein YbjT (DUF2867 family)